MSAHSGRLRRRDLRQLIRDRAAELGFDRTGFCTVAPAPRDAAAYRQWIDAGMGGEMAYMSRPDRVERTLDPRLTLPGARSMVVVTLGYAGSALPREIRDDPSRGLFARYAWGPDYHDIMLPRLEELGAFVDDVVAAADTAWRAYVDTGPVLERDAGARAGLGFTGRNTMLIDPRQGSWLLVGEVIVGADLGSDLGDETAIGDGAAAGTCGRCTRCLDSCPTKAFPEPYVLDARRCISYLTIELKGPIPRRLRSALGNHVFGCDICNDVCPYNSRHSRGAATAVSPPDTRTAPGPDTGATSPPPDESVAAPPLLELAALDDTEFKDRFHGTPVYRGKRRRLMRNVCVALGNWGAPQAVPALVRALSDPEPLVRGHAAWGLGRTGGRTASAALHAATATETDPMVSQEIEWALLGGGRHVLGTS